MHFPREPSRRHFQRWIILLGILFLHLAMLWMFKLGGNQRQVEAVQYLSLFNAPPIEKQTNKTIKSVPPAPNIRQKANVKKTQLSEAISNAPKIEPNTATPNIPNPDVSSKFNLDLDLLRAQAVQIERHRVKSDIEKMNDSKKLNLSVEATFDREVNKIKLPDCHSILLGKLMPERMRIIQDHSKKKFCS